jgi:hypothetical protein
MPVDDDINNYKEKWYMNIEIKSIGHHKAFEKAVQEVKRNTGIYKLTYLSEVYYYNFSTPFKWIGKSGKKLINIVYDNIPPLFYRDEHYDRVISDFNHIITTAQISDLEKRLISVVDIYGMIDRSTPLHIRFLLCVIALEALLLGKEDRDHIRKNLTEKITCLIGGSRELLYTFYNLVQNTSTDDNIAEKKMEARTYLRKKIHKIYDKRSKFAHSGVSNKKSKNVTQEDYDLVCHILRWIVGTLLQLRNKGIKHIENKSKNSVLEDKGSLDVYIQKYS